MWRVEYLDGVERRMKRYATPELAVTGACHLLDDGLDVFEIGSTDFSISAGPADIARIYAMWIKTPKHSMGF